MIPTRPSIRVFSAACTILLGNCAAPLPEDGVRTVRSTTPAGVAVRIASFAKWNEHCEQAGLPVITIASPPAHGTLTLRQAMLTAGNRVYSGATNCRDKQIQGMELWYAPAPGFRGTDAMRYQVDSGEQLTRFAATTDVR